jgi:hypothetical protein
MTAETMNIPETTPPNLRPSIYLYAWLRADGASCCG